MYQPAKVYKNSKKVQQLSRLESEHQRNQNRIRQLHRRNRELEEEIRHLSNGRSAPKNSAVSSQPLPQSIGLRSRKPKSLRRIGQGFLAALHQIQLGRYSLLFWIQVVSLMVGVALASGFAGFMLTRLIASLVG